MEDADVDVEAERGTEVDPWDAATAAAPALEEVVVLELEVVVVPELEVVVLVPFIVMVMFEFLFM